MPRGNKPRREGWLVVRKMKTGMWTHIYLSIDIFLYIVLFKMFSRWFFANKKLIITLRTWKFGDVT